MYRPWSESLSWPGTSSVNVYHSTTHDIKTWMHNEECLLVFIRLTCVSLKWQFEPKISFYTYVSCLFACIHIQVAYLFIYTYLYFFHIFSDRHNGMRQLFLKQIKNAREKTLRYKESFYLWFTVNLMHENILKS